MNDRVLSTSYLQGILLTCWKDYVKVEDGMLSIRCSGDWRDVCKDDGALPPEKVAALCRQKLIDYYRGRVVAYLGVVDLH